MPPLQDLLDLTGKTAIITGGAVGIGLGIAKRLHGAGANVVVVDLDPSATISVTAAFNDIRPQSAYALRGDVSEFETVSSIVSSTIQQFGSIDIVVNNAGIFPFAPLPQLDPELFDKIIATNLRSVYLFTRLASQQMIVAGKGGKIINVASVDALHPAAVGLSAYDASKHAVWGFTKSTALELAPYKIWVNAIAPGGVLTPGVLQASGADHDKARQAGAAVPMGRMGEPDDMGRVALFLASDMASYMTGSIVVADGGMLLQ